MDCIYIYVTNSKNKDLTVDVSTLGCTPLASSTSPLWNSPLIFLLQNYQLLLSLYLPWLSCLQLHGDTPCLRSQLLIHHAICLSFSLSTPEVLNQGWFWSPGDMSQCLETSLVVTAEGTSSGRGQECCSTSYKCPGQPPQQRMIWPQTLADLNLRNTKLLLLRASLMAQR